MEQVIDVLGVVYLGCIQVHEATLAYMHSLFASLRRFRRTTLRTCNHDQTRGSRCQTLMRSCLEQEYCNHYSHGSKKDFEIFFLSDAMLNFFGSSLVLLRVLANVLFILTSAWI